MTAPGEDRSTSPIRVYVPLDSADEVAAAMHHYADEVDDAVAAALLRLGATEVRIWRDYISRLIAAAEDASEEGDAR